MGDGGCSGRIGDVIRRPVGVEMVVEMEVMVVCLWWMELEALAGAHLAKLP
jgi:hypothetical protein